MAPQNYEIIVRGADDPIDPHKFKESFTEASREENKRVEFDLKYSVPQIRALIHKDLGTSLMEDLALSSSATSFQVLYHTITHLATRLGDSEQSMPQLWKDLVKIVISDSPTVTEEPAVEESLGFKLEELEAVGVHEEKTQDPSVAARINSNYSHNFSSATSVNNNSGNTVTPPNSSVSPEISVQQINPRRPNNVASMGSDSHTVNITVTPSALPSHTVNITVTPSALPSHTVNITVTPSALPPQEDNKLGFTVFAVELLGALTNLAVSSRPKHNQVLLYVVVACSTLAFSISSTGLVLHKKRPKIAKTMQKAAFLIGTFGFMGIMGMLLPSTITWCFTVSAFLVCMLMFVVASLVK